MAARRGRSQAKRPKRGGLPLWIWVLASMLLGAGLSVFVLTKQDLLSGRRGPQPNPAATAPPRSTEPVVAAPPAEPRKPKYDFYTLLPEKEAVIPDAELQKAQSTNPPKPAANEKYLLQAGAFRNAADADALKARLALLGLVANVEAETIKGERWHRVRLGPYPDLRSLESAKRQLAGADIDAIAVKAPRE